MEVEGVRAQGYTSSCVFLNIYNKWALRLQVCGAECGKHDS